MIINMNDPIPENGTKNFQRIPKPQPGAYVCQIISTDEGVTQRGTGVVYINVDIAEGESTGYYRNRYDRFGGRWGCSFPLYDSKSRNQMQIQHDFVNALEQSNPGYKWDNDFSALNGKYIGFSFQNRQYSAFTTEDGREIPSGWNVKPCYPYSIEEVRNGDVETPEPRPLSDQNQNFANNNFTQNNQAQNFVPNPNGQGQNYGQQNWMGSQPNFQQGGMNQPFQNPQSPQAPQNPQNPQNPMNGNANPMGNMNNNSVVDEFFNETTDDPLPF